MRRLDLQSTVIGALVSLALVVPVALIARLVAGDDVTPAWNGAFTGFVVVATLIGGGAAGRRQPDLPMMHGAAAGVLSYVAARVVSALASGDVPNVIALVFALLVFAAFGAVGGYAAAAFARSDRARRP